MKRQICILTKSYKHGGYCVAGIDMQTKEWIRVVNSEDPSIDEIAKEKMILDGKIIQCLDVVEFDFIKKLAMSCQTENWLLNPAEKPKLVKRLTFEELALMIQLDDDPVFVVNRTSLLSVDEITDVHRSLYLYRVQNLKIEATLYEYGGESRFKYKCAFEYKGRKYHNLSLTDPIYRNAALNGETIADALVVASLPCVPYSDGSFYKFIAKIISIDEEFAACLARAAENTQFGKADVKEPAWASPFLGYNLTVRADQTPGVVVFENYAQLKASIQHGISYYAQFEYGLENYQLALEHRSELKDVKSILEKTKKEIIKNYNAPLQVVEAQLNELIDLIKIPFQRIDMFIKQNEKASKKYEIMKFAKQVAALSGLQTHTESVLNSPAFFEGRWLNSSCSRTAWKTAVRSKVEHAIEDIEYILSLQNQNVASILAHYYQTLSAEKVEEFIISLQRASYVTETPKMSDEALAPVSAQIVKSETKIVPNISQEEREFTDVEVLKFLADSMNPYTGEIITGIDEMLQGKLIEIADEMERIQQKKNL